MARAAVTRDFFLPPARPRLTGVYADDRVLVFARDGGSLYASWDVSAPTFGQGPAELVVVDLRSRVLERAPAPSPVGSRFSGPLRPGATVRVELRRGDAVLVRSRWLVLPGPLDEQVPVRVMRVAPKVALPVRAARVVVSAPAKSVETPPSLPSSRF